MKHFKTPDLHAPRYRPQIVDIVNKDFFTAFKVKFPEYAHYSNKELKQKIQLINGEIWKTAINERDGIELPHGLGYLFIGTCPKKKGENTDYHVSGKYQKKVQHRNWESDDYIAKIFYTNYEQKYRFKFHELWGFKGVRQFKRAVSEHYPINWKRYQMIDNFQHISRLFRKQSYKLKKQADEQEMLKLYNEFAFD
ncbi:MAG TPA: hypothetical protein VGM30_10540 [Puia sp.]|jgi:hypothetical protein